MKRITLISMLIAISMCIFIIESQIPPPVPFPGIKAGLSNVIVLITMLLLDKKAAASVLIIKIILSGIFSGYGVGIIYSLSGGIMSFIVMSVLCTPLKNYIWVISTIGACAHNVGQTLVAMLIMNTTAILAYLPVLIISGIVTGFITGIISQTLVLKSSYIKKIFSELRKEQK